MDDTICAISTALGVGGISIIRVSGADAIGVVSNIFKGKNLNKVNSHTINYGQIYYKDEIIDEVLVSVMRAPKTYTVEDIVEINSHGGIAVTNRILQILLECGCRLAEPGEFTKRAFLNGRIDLIEAEAVNDVINAETENARSLSVSQLTGKLSKIVTGMKQDLLNLEAHIEVNIDYPEYEDIEDMTSEKVLNVLRNLSKKMQEIIDESKTAKLLRSGVNIALIGKPNVGKSSILNSLLEEDKAIVTDVAGTTRDVVEGKIILNGILVNFIDTAGIRNTDDYVEKIGVNKSFKKLEEADLVILVLENGSRIDNEDSEIINKIKNKKHIIFVNKNDLDKKINVDTFANVVYGNTVKADGLDDLKEEIFKVLSLDKSLNKDFTYVSNARQLALIENAKKSIDSAITAALEKTPVDLIEIDITNARKCLSELLGETYKDELLDELFSSFCLGK